MSAYEDAFILSMGLLAGKSLLLHLAMARARVGSKTPALPEDGRPFPLKGLLQTVLLSDLKFGTHPDTVTRLAGLERNATENEPFFAMAAFAYGTVAGATSAAAPALVLAYTASRYAHVLFYVGVRAQPYRALSFVAGLGIALFMAGSVVVAKVSSAGK
ncbi:hypothetical protein JKP88DRAFT_277180 [Tribonema minus]|uniref:Microsomal glutathione S-transferase 1 n=1 Tax=Tribonema minus TaxID=303371 RepID=A0A835YZ20_9STRA|nr:hypothetical protein JKP88DRAFT_277180 [Tribonema minus]